MSKFHVLMYHEIIRRGDFDTNNNSNIFVNQQYQDVLPKPLFVFLEEFEKQMEYLHKSGFTSLRLQDLLEFYYEGKPLPDKSVLITFDDMYKSVLIYAYPILKKYNFSAVGFVVLDWLFNEEKEYSSSQSVCLSKAELTKMMDVFEYANHSNRLHTRQKGIGALQMADRDSFFEDIKACEEFINTKKVYAYPFGISTDEVISWLRELEFSLAFTTIPGSNDVNSDKLRLARNGVLIDCDIEKFKAILNS